MIQFFISSTFRDMMHERDLLRKKVFPMLNKRAQQFGDSVSFCDLRWGVDTTDLEEKHSDRKVLSACLNEIDRSQYMMVFLGSRYGYITDESLAEEMLNLHDCYLDDYSKSITALEVEYGALRNQHCQERTLFYFRLPGKSLPQSYLETDPELAEKLHLLKEQIRSIVGSQVRFYHWDQDSAGAIALTAEDGTPLEKAIIHDAAQFLDAAYSRLQGLSEFARWECSVHNWVEDRASLFCARANNLDKLRKALQKHQLLALSGASGMGKTTLMCKLAQDAAADADVFFFPCSALDQTYTVLDFKKKLTRYLEQLLHVTSAWNWSPAIHAGNRQDHMAQWQDYVLDLLCRCTRPLFILIDSLDQLPDESIHAPLSLLPGSLPDHVRVVVSYTRRPGLVSSSYHRMSLRSLTEEDNLLVFNSSLSRSSKVVNADIAATIIHTKQGNAPLYYQLLSQVVILFDRMDFEKINSGNSGNMDSINAHLFGTLISCPNTLDGIVHYLLNTICQHIDPVFCHGALRLLAASHHGLREGDIQAIMTENGYAWSALTLHRFMYYMQDILSIRHDSSIDFSHSVIRRCAESYLDKKERRSMQNQILCMLRKTDDMDAFKYQELPYYVLSCGAEHWLVGFIEAHLYPEYLPMMELLGRSMVDASEKQDPRWTSQLCLTAQAAGGQLNFMSFMNHQIYPRINRMQAHYLDAYMRLYQLSMQLYQKHHDIQIVDDMIETCFHVVDLALNQQDMTVATGFAQQAIHCATELFRCRQDDRRLAYLCSSLLFLADVEIYNGSLRQALDYRQQAYELVSELADMLGVYTEDVIVKVCNDYLDSLIDCEEYDKGPEVIQFVTNYIDTRSPSLAVSSFYLKALHLYGAPFNFFVDPVQVEKHIRIAEKFIIPPAGSAQTPGQLSLLAQFHQTMGVLSLHKNELQKALTHTETALEIITQISNESDRYTRLRQAIETNLAKIYGLMGREKKSSALHRKLQKSTDSPEVAVATAIQQATVLWDAGQKRQALAVLDETAMSMEAGDLSEAALLQLFQCRGKQYSFCENDANLPLNDRLHYIGQFLQCCHKIYPIFPQYFADLSAAYHTLINMHTINSNTKAALELALEFQSCAQAHYEKEGPGHRLGNLVRYGQALLFAGILSAPSVEKRYFTMLRTLLNTVTDTYGSLDNAPNSHHLKQLQSSLRQLLEE